jgi:hypothetical protein
MRSTEIGPAIFMEIVLKALVKSWAFEKRIKPEQEKITTTKYVFYRAKHLILNLWWAFDLKVWA